MNFKLDKIIEEKQLNLFIILSFFLFFLIFVISKGYIKNEEFSDKIFLVSCVFSIELLYLFISNKFINYYATKLIDYFTLLIFFILIFILWNSEMVSSYLDVFLFFIFHLVLFFPIFFFLKEKNLFYSNDFKFDYFLLIIILSIFLSGLFYQIDYSTLNNFLIILILSLLILATNLFSNKLYRSFDILLSVIIFFILIKVFLLSSEKDAFHYSWVLGPINSLNDNYKLLDNVVSQYGYFNILLINKISQFINIPSTHTLVGFIISFFIIFYILFLSKILKLIKLPFILVTIFLCFLIFGNIGYGEFDGSMFIPSSSVFRFLPSLLTIVFFSQILEKNKEQSYKIIFFYISLFISLIWSIESLIFVIFSLGSFFFAKIFINLLAMIKLNKFFLLSLSNFKFSIFFGILFIFTLYFFLKDKNIYLFYEHALNSTTALSEEIINNKLTLTYLFLLFLSYFILRDSFPNKEIFYFNLLWFALFVSYSAYFLIRSVDSNIINILPFILFIICSMKVNSIQIEFLRKCSLYVIIFFSIISSVLSTIINKDKFFNNFLASNFFNTPIFLDKNYLPHTEILNTIKQYPNLPLTLISGKTIHNPNINLPTNGYGLPILPLESFNILKLNTKQKLMNNYFDKNDQHLILCFNKCNFYNSSMDSHTHYKIFLGDKVKVKKLNEVSTNKGKEFLYLLNKL